MGESWFKRITASIFYKVINRLSDMPIPENVGDFRLIDRRVVDEINKLPERTRFMKGLFAWPGFRRTTLLFDRDPRLAGQTKWNYTKLVHLALEGITSFSIRPLRLATGAGLVTSLAAIIMAFIVFAKTLMWGGSGGWLSLYNHGRVAIGRNSVAVYWLAGGSTSAGCL